MDCDSQEEKPGVGGRQGKSRQVSVYQEVGTAAGRGGAARVAGPRATVITSSCWGPRPEVQSHGA